MRNRQVWPELGAAPLRLGPLNLVDPIGSLPDQQVAIAAQADRAVGEQGSRVGSGIQQLGKFPSRGLACVSRPGQRLGIDFDEGVLDNLASVSHR